jgi:hypothetical protein
MDKVSILTDAINHIQDLNRTVKMLESTDSNDEDRGTDLARSSSTDLGTSEAETEGENRKNSSTDGPYCSELFDNSVMRYDNETSPSSRGWNLHQVRQLFQLNVNHKYLELG